MRHNKIGVALAKHYRRKKRVSQSANNEKKPLPIIRDNLLLCSEEACPLFEEDMGPGWARFCTIEPRAEFVTGEGETLCVPGIKLEHEELERRQRADSGSTAT